MKKMWNAEQNENKHFFFLARSEQRIMMKNDNSTAPMQQTRKRITIDS
jgi:hypothetical protein